MKVELSLTFHPQIDGQTKQVNQVLEQYLHCTTYYHQDNWSNLLSMVEFAYNNIVHYLTQQTPFFANMACTPSLTSKE
jgi:glycosylphosphatidylinositol phospholipase D